MYEHIEQDRLYQGESSEETHMSKSRGPSILVSEMVGKSLIGRRKPQGARVKLNRMKREHVCTCTRLLRTSLRSNLCISMFQNAKAVNGYMFHSSFSPLPAGADAQRSPSCEVRSFQVDKTPRYRMPWRYSGALPKRALNSVGLFAQSRKRPSDLSLCA